MANLCFITPQTDQQDKRGPERLDSKQRYSINKEIK